jgi:hypothetical protein
VNWLLPTYLADSDAAAQAATAAHSAAHAATAAAHQAADSANDWLVLPTHLPSQTDLLHFCHTMGPGAAALLILLGIIYLLFGYTIFKALITFNCTLVGAYVGYLIGYRGDAPYAGALLGAFVAAAITWPLMKYAVAMLGAIIGAVVGAAIWRTIGLDGNFAWAGAMTGLVFFGMLSFILFRGSIMIYTSLQGAVMLVFGLLGLAYKYQDLAPKVSSTFKHQQFLFPMLVFIPTIIGLIYQQNGAAEGTPTGKK